MIYIAMKQEPGTIIGPFKDMAFARQFDEEFTTEARYIDTSESMSDAMSAGDAALMLQKPRPATQLRTLIDDNY